MNVVNTDSECVNALNEFITQTKTAIDPKGDFLTNAIVYIRNLKRLNTLVKNKGRELGFDVENDSYMIFKEIDKKLSTSLSLSSDILSMLDIDKNNDDAFEQAKSKIEEYRKQITSCKTKLNDVEKEHAFVLNQVAKEAIYVENFIKTHPNQMDDSSSEEIKFAFLESLKTAISIKLNKLSELVQEKENYIKSIQDTHSQTIRNLELTHDSTVAKLKQDYAEKLDLLNSDNCKDVKKLKDEHDEKIKELQNDFFKNVQRLKAHISDEYSRKVEDEIKRYTENLNLEERSIDDRQTEIQNYIQSIHDQYTDVLAKVDKFYSDKMAELEKKTNDVLSEHVERIGTFEKTIKDLNRDKSNLEKSLITAKENIALNLKKIESKEAEIERLESQTRDTEDAKDKKMKELHKQNEKLYEEKSTLESQYDDISNTYKRYKDQCESEIESTKQKIQLLKREHDDALTKALNEKNELSQKYKTDVNRITTEFQASLDKCEKNCERDINSLKNSKKEEVEKLSKEHDEKIKKITSDYEARMKQNLADLENEHQTNLTTLKKTYENRLQEQEERIASITTSKDKEILTLKQVHEQDLQAEIKIQVDLLESRSNVVKDKEILFINQIDDLKKRLDDANIPTEDMDSNMTFYSSMNFKEKEVYLESLTRYLLKIQSYLRSQNLNYPTDLKEMIDKLIKDYLSLRVDIETERKKYQVEIADLKYKLQAQMELYKQTKDSIDRYKSLCNSDEEKMDQSEATSTNTDISAYVNKLSNYEKYIADLKVLHGSSLDTDDEKFKQILLEFQNNFAKLKADYAMANSNLKEFYDALNKLFSINMSEEVTQNKLMKMVDRIIHREKVYKQYISDLKKIDTDFRKSWVQFVSLLPENITGDQSIKNVRQRLQSLLDDLGDQLKYVQDLEKLVMGDSEPAMQVSSLRGELSRLKEKYTKDMNNADAKNKALKENESVLKKRVTDLEKTLQQHKNDIDELNLQNQTLGREKKQLNKKISNLEKNIKEISKQQETTESQKEKRIRQMQSEIDTQQEAINNLSNIEFKNNKRIASLEQEIADLDNTLKTKTQEMDAISKELEHVISQKKEMEQNYEQQIKELEEDLEGQKSLTQHSIDEYNKKVNELSTLNETLHDLNNQISIKDTSIESLQEDIDKHYMDIEKSKEELLVSSQRIDDLENELQEYRSQLEEYKSTDKLTRDDISAKNAKITELGETIKHNVEKIGRLSTDNDELLEDIRSKSEELKKIKSEFNKQSTEINELQNSVQMYKNTIAKNNSEIKKLNETVEDLENSLKSHNSLKDTNNTLSNLIKGNDRMIKKQLSDIEKYEAKIKENEAWIKQLQDNLSEKEEKLSGQLVEISNLKSRNNDLNKALIVEKNSVETNLEALEDLKKDYTTLQHAITQNETKIQSLNAQVLEQNEKVADATVFENKVLMIINKLLNKVNSNIVLDSIPNEATVNKDDQQNDPLKFIEDTLRYTYNKTYRMWNERANYISTIDEYVARISALENRYEELNKVRAEDQDIIQNLRNQLTILRKTEDALSEEVNEFEEKYKELQSLSGQKEQLMQDLNRLAYEKNSLSEQSLRIRSDITSYETQLIELKSSIDEKRSESSKIEENLKELKQKQIEVASTLEDVWAQRDEEINAVRGYEQQKTELVRDVKTLNQDKSVIIQMLEELTAQKTEMIDLIQKMTQQKNVDTQELQTLTDKKNDITRVIDELNVQKNQVSDSLEKLKDQQSLKTKSVAELEEQQKKVSDILQKLKDEEKSQNETLSELRKTIDDLTTQKATTDLQYTLAKEKLEIITKQVSERSDSKKSGQKNVKYTKRVGAKIENMAINKISDKLKNLKSEQAYLEQFLGALEVDYGRLITESSQNMPLNTDPAIALASSIQPGDTKISQGIYNISKNYVEIQNILEHKTRLYNMLQEEKTAMENIKLEEIQALKIQINALQQEVQKYKTDIDKLYDKQIKEKEAYTLRMENSIDGLVKFIRDISLNVSDEKNLMSVEQVNKLYKDYIMDDKEKPEAYISELDKLSNLLTQKLNQITVSENPETEAKYQALDKTLKKMVKYIDHVYAAAKNKYDEIYNDKLKSPSIVSQQYRQVELTQYQTIMDVAKYLKSVTEDNVSEVTITNMHKELERLNDIFIKQTSTVTDAYQESINLFFPDLKLRDEAGNIIGLQNTTHITEQFKTYIREINNIYIQIPEKFRKINFREFFKQLEGFSNRFETFEINDFLVFPRTIRYLIESFEKLDPTSSNVEPKTYKSIVDLSSQLNNIAESIQNERKFYKDLINANPTNEKILLKCQEIYSQYKEYTEKAPAAIQFFNTWRNKVGWLKFMTEISQVHSKLLWKMLGDIYLTAPSHLIDIFDVFTLLLKGWIANPNSNITFYQYVTHVDLSTIPWGQYTYLTEPEKKEHVASQMALLDKHQKIIEAAKKDKTTKKRKPTLSESVLSIPKRYVVGPGPGSTLSITNLSPQEFTRMDVDKSPKPMPKEQSTAVQKPSRPRDRQRTKIVAPK